MRGCWILNKMVLALLLTICSGGAAQVEEAVRRVGAEESLWVESAELAQRPATPSRTAPPAPRRDSKERRRPIIPRELPQEGEESEPQGLSLQAAIQRLLAANRDLIVKYQDIPKARADILSAGLIENPSVFLDGDGIPYGNYSPRRPGETSYEATFVQPFDVSGKRRQRLSVAPAPKKRWRRCSRMPFGRKSTSSTPPTSMSRRRVSTAMRCAAASPP